MPTAPPPQASGRASPTGRRAFTRTSAPPQRANERGFGPFSPRGRRRMPARRRGLAMKAPLTLLMRALGDALPAALLAVVLVVVGADVFARTVLHRPFQMAHELAIVAFAGVVWFGIVGTALSAEMFGVRFFVERLPRRLRMP